MFKRKTTTTLATTALAAAFVVLAGPSEGSSSLPITTCGQTVTTNAILTQDLACAGPGVIVGASGITIDLQGHTLSGDHVNDGIGNNSWDNVTIKNGVVRNFGHGVAAYNGADNMTISNLVLSGNTSQGAAIEGTSTSIKSSTASGNVLSGIQIDGDSASITSSSAVGNGVYGFSVKGDGASVKSSSAVANATGFVLEGDSTTVASSTASANGDTGLYIAGHDASVRSTKTSGNRNVGIVVFGDAATLRGNRAEGNGFGLYGFPSEFGIFVDNFTTAPVGTNIAGGNADPAECQPSSLCPAPASKSVKAGWTSITTCAQVVTTSAVLTKNLDCTGHGIIIASSGITVDLNGHVLKGDGGPDIGIVDTAGFDDVTIKNGVVRNFQAGVAATNGADSITISNVTASGNTSGGLGIAGNSASITSSTAAGNGGDGIQVYGDSAKITSSTAAGNGANGIYVVGGVPLVKSSSAFGNTVNGIYLKGVSASVVSATAAGNGGIGVYVDGGSASLKSTTASGNGTHGFFVSGAAPTLTRNRAEANGFPGGASDSLGWGIFADGNPVAVANIARGNDDPDGCNPYFLC